MIKKFSIITCFLLGIATMQAQHQVTSFFDELGTARIQTEEFSQAHDTIVMVDHRIDDVIWSRMVYRVIDMRFKQNYQLYFPTTAADPDYRNLLLVIRDAIIDGLPVYEKDGRTIKPDFSQEPMAKRSIPSAMFVHTPGADYTDDTTHFQICCSNDMLIHCDTTNNDSLSANDYAFGPIVKNQIKYLIQEMVFFDKHTSRMYVKIIGIAPLWADLIETRDSTKVMNSLRESIMFWIPFDKLRPYMAMQYIIPNRNETKRVTFDEFFRKRLFTSYIVGEGNMYNRWIPDYSYESKDVRKEQERIANELLNFEQDLWEY